MSRPEFAEEYIDALSDRDAARALRLARESPELFRERDDFAGNILHILCESDEPNVVAEAIRQGADVNDGDIEMQSPLHVAVYSGSRNVVELLLKAGARMLPNEHGATPLDAALGKGDRDIAVVLKAAGAILSLPCTRIPDEASSVAHALLGGAEDCVELLFQWGVSFEDVLAASIAVGDAHWVRWTLQRSSGQIDWGSLGTTHHLLDAVEKDSAETIQNVFCRGAGDTASGQLFGTLLIHAIEKGSYEIADALLAQGAGIGLLMSNFESTLALKTRRAIMGYLRGREHLANLEFFRSTLTDPDDEIRWRSIEALARLDDRCVVRELINALRDSNKDVRWSAAKALEKITGQKCANDSEWETWWQSEVGADS